MQPGLVWEGLPNESKTPPEEASMNQHTDRQAMLRLADDLDESVGLYRKMPDGQMVEIHVKKIAMIQTALRATAALSRFDDQGEKDA